VREQAIPQAAEILNLKTTQIVSEKVVYPIVLIPYRAFSPTLELRGWAYAKEDTVNQG